MENDNTTVTDHPQEATTVEEEEEDTKKLSGVSALSKRQIKKLKKRDKWLERKGEKRLRERAKAREKRAFARANNIDLGPSRKALKRCTMATSSCKVGVTIDLSFDHLMIDKDIAKLTKQILRCYTLNRRAAAPMQFSLTSFVGKCAADMQKHNGHEHWDVNFCTGSYLEVHPRDRIVYLTSESENTIDHLEPDCVYIIGGLVDHNSQKGLCHKLAVEAGVRHGRLPLDKFLQMKARKVLTVDHVFEIVLRVTEGKSWQEAFLQVLPERKNAQPIQAKDPGELNSSESSEEDEPTELVAPSMDQETEDFECKTSSQKEDGQCKTSSQKEDGQCKTSSQKEDGQCKTSSQNEDGQCETSSQKEDGDCKTSYQNEDGDCKTSYQKEDGECKTSYQKEDGERKISSQKEDGEERSADRTKPDQDETNDCT